MIGRTKHRAYGLGYKLAVAIMLVFGSGVWQMSQVEASQVLNRSLHVESNQPGVSTTHVFTFTLPTNGNVGSLQLDYCINDPLPESICIPPNGLDLTGAILQQQTGDVGFSIHASSDSNTLVLTRVPVTTTNASSTYTFTAITNPTDVYTTIYVRITSYASTDASGPIIDKGGVAFSTSTGLGVGGTVPPFLMFCSGLTVTVTCTSAQGSQINFGEFSANTTRFATSQFAAATNDPNGYVTMVFGTTLASGNNVIAASTTPDQSHQGSNQFGLNLRDNSTPDCGSDKDGIGFGVPSADYNTQDFYKFVNGDVIVSSPSSTEPNRFTVCYIANVQPNQPVGVYTATMTFVTTAQF